ncbi:MAG: sensor histidine kinase [Candidatus Nitronauta litoralis]|uniref:histidine kinase n=1 Tax=Candidatus Nitronauta litoralis TaxID=2705533 RepID=A0A7T0BYJ8_9BACT|nr:MAG: sensor histidine kinase [Candidatus Nitronauta litoralis]
MKTLLSYPHGKSGITPKWIPVSLGILALLVIGMVGFSFQKGLDMITVYAPLINADTEIKLNVAVAHMWVEEILAGDTTKNTKTVSKYLDQADGHAQTLLEGVKDKEMRRIVKNVIQELKEFREIAQRRFTHRATSLTGSSIDHHFDEVYSDFTRNADQIKLRFQQLIATDLQYFKITQFTLMTVCFLISLVTGIALFRFERFRDRLIKALHTSNENLENEIEERILAENKLIESKEQLRRLSNQLQIVREEEKTHIAREVHDELGQTLTALKMELSCFHHDLKAGSREARNRIGTMSKLIDNTIQSVQRIATELRPQILDVLGLAEAVRWETSEFQKRTAIQCHLDLPQLQFDLNRDITTAVFRIFQEAMTNIARHSKAKVVKIALEIDAQQVTLDILDNGKGINSDEIINRNSLGLLGMHERAHFLNGCFNIYGKPTEGTRVRVSIPLELNGSIQK